MQALAFGLVSACYEEAGIRIIICRLANARAPAFAS